MAGIRDYSRPTTVALIAVGFIIASTAQRSWSQQPDPDFEEFLKKFPKVTEAFKEVKTRSEPVAGDNAHQTLLRLRLGAAARYAEFRFKRFSNANGFQPQQLYSAFQSVGEAEFALLDNATDRIAAHDRLVDVARAIESVYKVRVEAGMIAEQDWLSARQFCATCELAAIDARRNPPKLAPQRVYPPPSSDFAPDTIERTMEQGMAALRQLASDVPSVAPGLADNERKKLLMEQRATLLLALDLRIRIMESGAPNSGVGTLFGNDLLLKLSKNELALDDRPSNQLRIAERDLVLAKVLEAIAQKGQETREPWYRPRYDRLSAELKLMELRQAFPGVAAAKLDAKPRAQMIAPKLDPFALTKAEEAESGKFFSAVQSEPQPQRTMVQLPLGPEGIKFRKAIELALSAKPTPDDDEWRKLAELRRAWSARELGLQIQVFQAGADRSNNTNDTLAALRQFEESSLALAKDPTERTAIIESTLSAFRGFEDVNRIRYTAGLISGDDVWPSRFERLDAQIRLLDLRRK